MVQNPFLSPHHSVRKSCKSEHCKSETVGKDWYKFMWLKSEDKLVMFNFLCQEYIQLCPQFFTKRVFLLAHIYIEF